MIFLCYAFISIMDLCFYKCIFLSWPLIRPKFPSVCKRDFLPAGKI